MHKEVHRVRGSALYDVMLDEKRAHLRAGLRVIHFGRRGRRETRNVLLRDLPLPFQQALASSGVLVQLVRAAKFVELFFLQKTAIVQA